MTRYLNSSSEYKDVKSIKGLISDYNNPYGEKPKTIPAEELENIFKEEGFFMP
jgi:hypothetical protein